MFKFIKSFFVPKLYVVGMPISNDSVEQAYLDFFSEDVQTICIMTGGLNVNSLNQSLEYKSASTGFDIIIQNGYQFINLEKFTNEKKAVVMALDSWNGPNRTRKSANDVGKYVIQLAGELRKKHPNARILRIAPGSPYLYDGVSGYMIDNYPNIKVIDTKSSAKLAYEKLQNTIGTNLPAHIVEPTDGVLLSNCVNLIGCVGFVYKDYVILENIINGIKPKNRIFDIKIGYVNSIREIKKHDLQKLYEYTPGYSPSIIAIIDEN